MGVIITVCGLGFCKEAREESYEEQSSKQQSFTVTVSIPVSRFLLFDFLL